MASIFFVNHCCRSQPYYRVGCVKTQTVLHLSASETRNNLESWNSRSSSDQLWTFTPVIFPTIYWIRNKLTERVLESSSNSRLIVGAHKNPSNDPTRFQMWHLQSHESDNTYTIRNVENHMVMDCVPSENAEIIAYEYRGGQNQHWLVEQADKELGIHSTSSFYIRLSHFVHNSLPAVHILSPSTYMAIDLMLDKGKGSATAVTRSPREGTSQQWEFDPVPLPPLYWTTIQNARTGAYLAQNASGGIIASSGATSLNDFSVQWRFIPRGASNFCAIVNRATGHVLDHHGGASAGVSVRAEHAKLDEPYHHWTLEAVADTTAIVNTKSGCALDHFEGREIQAYKLGSAPSSRHWIFSKVRICASSVSRINTLTIQVKYLRHSIA